MGWGKCVESAVSIVHTMASGQELEGHVLSWHYWPRLSSSVLNSNASPPLPSEGWCHSFLCQPTSCKQICNTNQHTRIRLGTLEGPVGSFDGQSRFLPHSFALSRFNSVFLSLTMGARQKGTWLLGNGMILGCLSQRFKVRRPFQL